jgi:hypothetical protein
MDQEITNNLRDALDDYIRSRFNGMSQNMTAWEETAVTITEEIADIAAPIIATYRRTPPEYVNDRDP